MHNIVVINKNVNTSMYKCIQTGRVPRGPLTDKNVPRRQNPLVIPALGWIKEKGTEGKLLFEKLGGQVEITGRGEQS